MEGKWLIVYPEQQLDNQREREVYAKYQDSILQTKSLQLVNFTEDQQFFRQDSVAGKHGQWMLMTDRTLLIKNGGKGLKDFTGELKLTDNVDKLNLEESISLEDEQVRVVWHLVRMKEKKDLALFEDAMNSWRIPPRSSETYQQLRLRVRHMLLYAAAYFDLVSRSSSFFMPQRMPLPFTYFQHGMGLSKNPAHNHFNTCFYDEKDTAEAMAILNKVFKEVRSKAYPDGKNFVEEYAKLYQMMAEGIVIKKG